MSSLERPGAGSEDWLYKELHSVFPSPHSIHCSNSQETLPFESEMTDLNESSSPHENLEFFSGTEESEDQVTTLQSTASVKKTQCCPVTSVAVQCDSIAKITKGVQWEPIMMVSQGVQCMPMAQVAKGQQCFGTFMTQCAQQESVLMVTKGVQYEYSSEQEETAEKQFSNDSNLSSKEVPFKELTDIDHEYVSHSNDQVNGSDDHRVLSILADLSITLPSIQSEFDKITSSRSTVSVSNSNGPSQASSVCDVIASEDEHDVELSNCSPPVPSTSGVKFRRKRKSACRVRKRRRSKKRVGPYTTSNRNESTSNRNNSNKRLPLEPRTDGSRSLTEDVNSGDNDKNMSRCVLEEAANPHKKAVDSVLQEASTSSAETGEELVVEESPEELLKQMGNYENCLPEEDTRKNKIDTQKEIIKDNHQEIPSQKIITSCQQRDATSEVAVSSESQRIGGLSWFSSLACERHSSPESIAEDLFEELTENRCNYKKNIEQKVQIKNTKILDANVSFRKVRCSTPIRETRTARNSDVQILEDDSCRSPAIKRKKVTFDASESNTSASSKRSAQLVPYSDSDSDTESFSTGHLNKSKQKMSKKILNKEEPHCKSTVNNRIQKAGIIPSELCKQSASEKANRDRVWSSQLRKSQSNSVKNRRAFAVTSSSSSDDTGDEDSGGSDIRSRSKIRRVQENIVNVSLHQKHVARTRSGNVSVHSPNRGSKHSISPRDSRKSNPARISIWSSDEDDNCRSSVVSRSTVGRRTPYSQEEREAILWYIIDHKFYKLVKGKILWERMEKEQVCGDRTWQSMKEHFLKKILPQIETYKLEPEITKRLVGVRK